jgi:sec-independent protein translocase protein TatC
MATHDNVSPLIEHIIELRDRLLKAVAALLVGVLIGFIGAKRFLEILIAPLQGVSQLQLLRPTENIIIYFKAALILGAILAAPFIIYQLIAFIVPGLTPSEKRMLYLAMPLAFVLFATGVAFCAFVVLPFTLRYLQLFLTDLFKAEYSVEYYMGFVANFILWVGVAFETPLVIALLARLGVVSPQTLARSWRYAIVISAVLAAVITPTPDPFTMGIVMVPLLLLYALGLLLARFTYRSRSSPDDEPVGGKPAGA